MADADVVLVLLDAADDLTPDDQAIIDSVREIPHLIVLNKSDKPAAISVADLTSIFVRRASNLWETQAPEIIATSAKTGSGLDHLQRSIVEPFTSQDASSNGFLVTDARHHDLLIRSADEIRHSIELLEQRQSEEIVLIGLHNALRYLGQITGETTTEDMLTRIFSTFCIGK
jgi:tRNA modification GTPase